MPPPRLQREHQALPKITIAFVFPFRGPYGLPGNQNWIVDICTDPMSFGSHPDSDPNTQHCLRGGKSVFRIRDVYSGSRILIFTHPEPRIPNPETATKESGKKNLYCHRCLFCSRKFHKIENNLILEMLKKKILVNFQRIIELFN